MGSCPSTRDVGGSLSETVGEYPIRQRRRRVVLKILGVHLPRASTELSPSSSRSRGRWRRLTADVSGQRLFRAGGVQGYHFLATM